MFYLSKTDVAPTAEAVTCTDSCPFTETEKQQIADWEQSYAEWKDQSRISYDASSLVNAISFFVVSAPLFFLHYRILRREYLALRDTENSTGVFSIYYYIAALGTLIVAIVFTAMFINTILRTWVITDASRQDDMYSSQAMMATETQNADAIINCADKCGFTEDQVASAKEWKADYEKSNAVQVVATSWQASLSRTIAGILVTLPVFFYHWRFIRRESKKNKEQPIS
jgi:heme/copper-type cytochrome/quinol oxidase subunit 1